MDTQLALSGHRALRPLPQALKALALLLLCLLALPLGAFDWESASYALLSTERLLQQAADVTTVKYPDAETVQLDSATHIRYAADGTYFQVVDMAVKILTEKGVESSKVLTSYYNVSYARAKITQVEIIKHDGAVLPVDLALSRRTRQRAAR